jgi:hypothetical protein
VRTLLVASLLAFACQNGSSGAPSAYRTDLENICDAEARSGALEQDPNRRSLVVAQWIAGRLQSEQGRKFLASLVQLAPAEKGKALRREAAAVGLERCPLADTWK